MKGISPQLLLTLLAFAAQAKAEAQSDQAGEPKAPCDCPACSLEHATKSLVEARAKVSAAKAAYEKADNEATRLQDDLMAAQKAKGAAQEAFDKAADDYNAQAPTL